MKIKRKNDNGFIAINRAILKHKVFEDSMLYKVFSYCIIRASYKTRSFTIKKNGKSKTIKVYRGQFISGRISCAKELNIGVNSYRRSLKKLSLPEYDLITIKNEYTHMLITVKNYNKWQLELD